MATPLAFESSTLEAPNAAIIYAGSNPQVHGYGSSVTPDAGQDWTRGELIKEILALRGRVAELEGHKRAHEDSLAQMDIAESVANGLSGVFCVLDDEARLVHWNDSFEGASGYSAGEITDTHFVAFFRGPDQATVANGIQEAYHRGQADTDAELVSRDGSRTRYHFMWLRRKIQGQTLILGAATDIDGRAALEEQLRAAQRMEVVGRLAGGVAHDFNNILTVINGYADFTLDVLDPDSTVGRDIREIRQSGERAVRLIRQLLAFARPAPRETALLDISDIVLGLEKMLQRIIGDDIVLTAAPGKGIWSVEADPTQIEQVIVNLVVNARDAMPEGGRLTIAAVNVELSDEHVYTPLGLAPGPYVALSVSDTGDGMTDEIQARIFEPFFTTKRTDQGTGLGLSVVSGIVKQAGGNIHVHSKLGEGTAFTVYLPRSPESMKPRPNSAAKTDPPRGAETVLVVDDEESVRTVVCRMLETVGYTVLQAGLGSDALHLAEQHEDSIDLLLTDVVMPGMNGCELAQQLSQVRPKVKALYMSGYSRERVSRHAPVDPTAPIMQKPLSFRSLASAVREVLDR